MGPQIQHNDKELWQHKRQAYEGDSLPYRNMKTSPTKTSGSWWIRVEIDFRNQGRCMEKAHKNLQQASALPECLGSAKLHPCNVSKFLSSRRDGRSTDRNAWRPGRSESSETKPTIENPHSSGLLRGFLHLPISSDRKLQTRLTDKDMSTSFECSNTSCCASSFGPKMIQLQGSTLRF